MAKQKLNTKKQLFLELQEIEMQLTLIDSMKLSLQKRKALLLEEAEKFKTPIKKVVDNQKELKKTLEVRAFLLNR